MEFKIPFKLKVRLQKLALYSQEEIYLENFTNIKPKDITIVAKPFPHMVVENFFKPDVYEALCKEFTLVKERGLSKEKKSETQFHIFEIEYDGYVYTPPATLDLQNPLSLFFSLEWNNFFSKLFNQFTTFETTFAFHHHPAGDRTGFVHNDFADKFFLSSRKLPNGVIYGNYAPLDCTRRRVISILFYLNNDSWGEGDGGETGLYSLDKQTLLRTIPPKNNSLFAFQTSQKSMHAFQNNKVERNSFVQWFHDIP